MFASRSAAAEASWAVEVWRGCYAFMPPSPAAGVLWEGRGAPFWGLLGLLLPTYITPQAMPPRPSQWRRGGRQGAGADGCTGNLGAAPQAQLCPMGAWAAAVGCRLSSRSVGFGWWALNARQQGCSQAGHPVLHSRAVQRGHPHNAHFVQSAPPKLTHLLSCSISLPLAWAHLAHSLRRSPNPRPLLPPVLPSADGCEWRGHRQRL